MAKQFYKIPCTWQVCGTMIVEAESLKDAITEAEINAPLPSVTSFIDGSFEVNHEMIPWYNKNLTKEEKEDCQAIISF